MRRPAGRKASPKKEARKSNHAAAAKGAALADLITTAPRLSDPDVARSRVSDWLADVSSADSKSLKSLLSKQPIIGTLVNSLAESSPYLWDLTTREPERLLRLLLANPEQHFATLLRDHGHAAAVSKDEAEAMRELRRMKTEAALLIALADMAVNGAVRFALAEAGRARRLVLKDKTKTQAGSGYIVLAMGKMGAFELNYSSDIDLIVLYDPAAPALPADAEPSMLYVRLTQRLVKLLQERTADGYVFRTDLRLRPDPASTAVAISKAAALSYYESVGQNWERAAMIKARACAGDIGAGEEVLHELAPFVWRKYLDFGALADVHAMKRQINAYRGHGEIAVEGHNIKLGRGGIREI